MKTGVCGVADRILLSENVYFGRPIPSFFVVITRKGEVGGRGRLICWYCLQDDKKGKEDEQEDKPSPHFLSGPHSPV